MSDFIFIRRSRNILSSVLHIVLNLALGVGSVAITLLTKSWALGIILVIISKWRIFAVRPRYWWLNIKSNLVDLIVGISFVLIAYCSGDSLLPVHFVLAICYSLWLIILKPRSTSLATSLQSLAAVFLGTTAVTLMSANADSIFLIAPCFLIGYSAVRHILIQSDDHDFSLVPLTAGLVAAEIAWLCHSWLIVYSFASTGIIIPQLSIIMSLAAFAFGVTYQSILSHDGKADPKEVTMPIIFALSLAAILIIWLSRPIFNI